MHISHGQKLKVLPVTRVLNITFQGKRFEFFYVYKCTNQRKLAFHTIMNMLQKRDDQTYYFLITLMYILLASLPSEIEIKFFFST